VETSGLRELWQDQGLLQALRDVDKLVALAHTWQEQEPALGLPGYVARLHKHIDEQSRETVPVEFATDAVEVATVHAAKGREWPVVFIADTALPSTRASQVEHVLWDEHWGLIISDGNNRTKSKGPDPLGDLRRDLRRRARNEERAIWYVALTRARERLVITHSRCEVDPHGCFQDAGTALAADETDDRPVHFFHELWEHVRTASDATGEIFRGPGPCSGAIAEAVQPVSQRPALPSRITPSLRAAWERAVAPGVEQRTEAPEI
jgi:superfamily I DNA/RNA helicase